MKNRNFFAIFFQSMSKARKVNLCITFAISIAFACLIGFGWHDGGCEFRICLTGAIFGFMFPFAIWSCVDDVLA